MHAPTEPQLPHPMRQPDWRDLWPERLIEWQELCKPGAEKHWDALARLLPHFHISGWLADEHGIGFGIIFDLDENSKLGIVYPRFTIDEQLAQGYRIKAPAEAFISGRSVSLDDVNAVLTTLIAAFKSAPESKS